MGLQVPHTVLYSSARMPCVYQGNESVPRVLNTCKKACIQFQHLLKVVYIQIYSNCCTNITTTGASGFGGGAPGATTGASGFGVCDNSLYHIAFVIIAEIL